MIVGKKDVFERKYMGKFRNLASQFGEFVLYERDRGARDIGVHLTKKDKSGNELMSSTLCWFQMKGKMASALTQEAFETSKNIQISLQVNHLKFWYLQPMPTYLVLYIESVDEFLILNIQNYVKKTWGNNILTLPQKTATVEIPTSSVLDEQAFDLILRKGDVKQWVEALDIESETATLCLRDYDLIYRIATANIRGFEHKLTIVKWQSKLRTELHFKERPFNSSDEWQIVREHWEARLPLHEIEEQFPYLEFKAYKNQVTDEDDDFWDDDEEDFYSIPDFELMNGVVVHGESFMPDEVIFYELAYTLNDLGKQMYEWITIMETAEVISIDKDGPSYVSVAHWHSREV